MRHRMTKLFATSALLMFTALVGCAGGSGGSSGGEFNPLEAVGKGMAGMIPGVGGQAASAGVSAGFALEKAMRDFTPEQEYYLGRAVAAQVVSQYPIYENDAANEYVNLVGRSLSEHSERPEVFAGYNFQILESDEANAFAAPGAFIFITRGMLRLCDNEHELAAVLAHEVIHIEQQHGLKSIKQSRWTDFGVVVAKETVNNVPTVGYASAVSPIVGGMADDIGDTLFKKGYSRELESEADSRGAELLQTVGYDPSALVSVLRKLGGAEKTGGIDIGKTHPNPGSRAESVSKRIGNAAPVPISDAMKLRFGDALAGARAK